MKSHGWTVLALVLLLAAAQVAPTLAAERSEGGSDTMSLVPPPPPGDPDATGGKEGDPDSWSDGQNVVRPEPPKEDQPVLQLSVAGSWWGDLVNQVVALLR